jgi:hypothetical protein
MKSAVSAGGPNASLATSAILPPGSLRTCQLRTEFLSKAVLCLFALIEIAVTRHQVDIIMFTLAKTMLPNTAVAKLLVIAAAWGLPSMTRIKAAWAMSNVNGARSMRPTPPSESKMTHRVIS